VRVCSTVRLPTLWPKPRSHLQRHQQHLHGRVLGKGRVAVGTLQQGYAQRPYVGRRAVTARRQAGVQVGVY
jgi:hypothetical protein